ncbi:hypothetical protein [Desulfosporosinus nitroreducens]|uniref:Uncharacterized protein n=1 Tax=Desulfosporosinus nitroreducens TaxID=2018668 RepID=A0ABT8QVE6_9FIRM|nr:hypothetical protein [Desulfosporosinus nitroreducens]MDO0825321.1 hypothetical protein [Desulfosporosinus nitroreducens]
MKEYLGQSALINLAVATMVLGYSILLHHIFDVLEARFALIRYINQRQPLDGLAVAFDLYLQNTYDYYTKYINSPVSQKKGIRRSLNTGLAIGGVIALVGIWVFLMITLTP